MLELDDAMEFYESTKRENGYFLFYYPDKNKFRALFDPDGGQTAIRFIDSNAECLKIIDSYLNSPQKRRYREECQSEMRSGKNPVVSFLWYFEHVDGAYNFGLYEKIRIEKILKAWCEKSGIMYEDLKRFSTDPSENQWIIDRFGPLPE